MGNIIMKAMPFDSEVTINPEGQEEYDRVAHSRDLADWLGAYFSNGILVRGSDMLTNELQILHLSAMTCVVKPGIIVINGRTGFLEAQETVEFDVGGTNPRIDRVIAELNVAERNVYIKILKGTASVAPTVPEVTQTEDIYQIPIAQVRINANQAVIASVTDERSGHISNVLLNQAPRTDVTADNIKLSEQVRTMYGLSVDNANVDKALEANPPIPEKTFKLKYFTTSQPWSVPDGVTEVSVYIVGGGYNGGTGETNPGDVVAKGGAGGSGGKIRYIPIYPVNPETSIPVVIGSIGGISSFDMLSSANDYNYQQSAGTGSVDVLGVWGNKDLRMCPLDGKYYGVPGASGGDASKQNNSAGNGNDVNLLSVLKCVGGVGLRNPPPFLTWSGGGGATFDNNGNNASMIANSSVPGKGASASPNTGNGGGGGGAHYKDYQSEPVGAPGGNGGSGIVILKYLG